MADHDTESISGLIHSILEDARGLIREEIGLARAEIREEFSNIQTAGIAFGAAALAAFIGALLLCGAIGGAVAHLLRWPPWTGYGIVAVLLLGSAFLLVRYGRRRLADVRGLPVTTGTIKENLAWMQSKSAGK